MAAHLSAEDELIAILRRSAEKGDAGANDRLMQALQGKIERERERERGDKVSSLKCQIFLRVCSSVGIGGLFQSD